MIEEKFIFRCVESESIVKNRFHNWTLELECIWHILGKLCYFWLLLSAPVQAASGLFKKLVAASAKVLEKSQIF